MRYKLYILNREYTEWKVCNADTLAEIEKPENFFPNKEKLFTNDVFEYDDGKSSIFHSVVRVGGSYPGVLVLEGNRTYGRPDKRLLYKCIPDDRRLPIFLVPYEIKSTFSKNILNKYITFRFNNWSEKHPHGIITNVIGDVDSLSNFYEYQLFCKSLHDSIQEFKRATSHALKKKSEMQYIDYIKSTYPTIEDRTDNYIITIDPKNSQDFDDAIGIIPISEEEYILSIYIANVPLWMEVLNLWKSFSKRIATIYLPDRKRPMLPTVLSDCLCSLQEGQLRMAFCIDIRIDKAEICDISYSNSMIRVTKNYTYDDSKLCEDVLYKSVFSILSKLIHKRKYIDNIKSSHDVVAYIMILMNHECAKKLVEFNEGIYRSLEINNDTDIPEHLPREIKKHVTIWHCTGGQYKLFKDRTSHDLVSDGLENYVHITSPIRRLVDLLNMLKLQTSLRLITYGDDAIDFYDKWLGKIDYINTTMRAIRRVQCDCSLLNLCFTEPKVLEEVYYGWTFDKLQRHDGLYQYMVYIPKLKINSRLIVRSILENYKKMPFKIYTFTDEMSLKRKIRLQLAE